jgi:F-type H+-transporting ATPase subunit delta
MNSRIAVRFAQSFVSLAKEQGELDAVYQDAQFIERTISGSRELQGMLRSPIIKTDKKNGVLKALFGSNVLILNIKK